MRLADRRHHPGRGIRAKRCARYDVDQAVDVGAGRAGFCHDPDHCRIRCHDGIWTSPGLELELAFGGRSHIRDTAAAPTFSRDRPRQLLPARYRDCGSRPGRPEPSDELLFARHGVSHRLGDRVDGCICERDRGIVLSAWMALWR
jgi:hypothetical protein